MYKISILKRKPTNFRVVQRDTVSPQSDLVHASLSATIYQIDKFDTTWCRVAGVLR